MDGGLRLWSVWPPFPGSLLAGRGILGKSPAISDYRINLPSIPCDLVPNMASNLTLGRGGKSNLVPVEAAESRSPN